MVITGEQMKILITRGAGFIGSHLAERLLEQGHEVLIIDNLWTGRLANIEKIQNNEQLHLIVDTILNESVMNELIFKVDHNLPYPHSCSQVIDVVHLEYQLIHHGLVQYGIDNQMHPVIVLNLFKVCQFPGPEIVNNENLLVQLY